MKAVAERTEVIAEPCEPPAAQDRLTQSSPGIVLEFPTKDAKSKLKHQSLKDLISKRFCPTGFLGI
jgi:hypothetical protein